MQLVSSDRFVRQQSRYCFRRHSQHRRRTQFITLATVAGLALAFYAGWEKGSWSIRNLAQASEIFASRVTKFSEWMEAREVAEHKRDQDIEELKELIRQLPAENRQQLLKLVAKNAACSTSSASTLSSRVVPIPEPARQPPRRLAEEGETPRASWHPDAFAPNHSH